MSSPIHKGRCDTSFEGVFSSSFACSYVAEKCKRANVRQFKSINIPIKAPLTYDDMRIEFDKVMNEDRLDSSLSLQPN